MGTARHPFCPSQHLLEGNQRAAGDRGRGGGLWQKLPHCSAAGGAAFARRQPAGELQTMLHTLKGGEGSTQNQRREGVFGGAGHRRAGGRGCIRLSTRFFWWCTLCTLAVLSVEVHPAT